MSCWAIFCWAIFVGRKQNRPSNTPRRFLFAPNNIFAQQQIAQQDIVYVYICIYIFVSLTKLYSTLHSNSIHPPPLWLVSGY